MEIQPSRQSDDTDLRRAYVHLSEAQRLSRTGSFTWDFDRGELLWSEELCRIFEFDPATTITTDLVGQFVHPEDMPAFVATLEGAAAGRNVDLPFRITTVSGISKHLHAVGHRFEHAAERPVIIGAVKDVTERKVVDEALHKARAELAHVARLATLERADSFHRARGQSAAYLTRHQRQHLPAHVGGQSSEPRPGSS